MTIELGTIHRARPVCPLCGGVYAWHTSARSQQAAIDAAQSVLADHIAFWHTHDDGTDAS
jgi:hypothetical protein